MSTLLIVVAIIGIPLISLFLYTLYVARTENTWARQVWHRPEQSTYVPRLSPTPDK